MDEQTYYEILEVNPNATAKEIQRAYDHAKETFHADSPAIYSLYNDEEVGELQSAIEEAYQILMDDTLRKKYDQDHLHIPEGTRSERPVEAKGTLREKEVPLSFSGLSIPIEEEVYRGKTLKSIRERMGVDLKTISGETKISVKVLEWIEEETWEKLPALVYLKGFLKGYAQALNLDVQKVVDGYLQFLPGSKKP